MAQTTVTATPGTRFQLPAGKRRWNKYEVFMIDYNTETVHAKDLQDYGVPGATFYQDYTFADFTRRTGLAIPARPLPEPTTLF